MQGTDIANKGGAPGAVVTVKCDYRAVSFAIGIVGIIYEVSRYGGASIATVAGLILSGQRKGVWYIPAGQYAIKYGASKDTNITAPLKQICEEILAENLQHQQDRTEVLNSRCAPTNHTGR